MAQPKQVVASRACHDCGDRAQIKLNKNYLAYYYCGSCNSHHRFNREISANLAAKFDRMNGKGNSSNDNGQNDEIRDTNNARTGERSTSEEAESVTKESSCEESGAYDGAASGTNTGTGHAATSESETNGASGGNWLDDFVG